MKVVFNYLKSDIIKKQRSFKIGLLTVFLVILFTAILMNIIGLTPLIFLRLAENTAGETDIMMLPLLNKLNVKYKSSAIDSLFNINNTNTFQLTQQNITNLSSLNNYSAQLVSGINIQFLDFPAIENVLMQENYIEGVAPRWIFKSSSSYYGVSTSSSLLIINSNLENKYGFGRNLDLDTLGFMVNKI